MLHLEKTGWPGHLYFENCRQPNSCLEVLAVHDNELHIYSCFICRTSDIAAAGTFFRVFSYDKDLAETSGCTICYTEIIYTYLLFLLRMREKGIFVFWFPISKCLSFPHHIYRLPVLVSSQSRKNICWQNCWNVKIPTKTSTELYFLYHGTATIIDIRKPIGKWLTTT